MQKREEKVKLGNGLSLHFYYKVLQRNASTFDHQFGFFLFRFKVFLLFFL